MIRRQSATGFRRNCAGRTTTYLATIVLVVFLGWSGGRMASATTKNVIPLNLGVTPEEDLDSLLPGDTLAQLEEKYPQLSTQEIVDRQETLTRSKMISETTVDDSSSAGGYLDYLSNTYWVMAIDAVGLQRMNAVANTYGISAQGKIVQFSMHHLETIYATVSSIVSSLKIFDLSIDVKANHVRVKLLPYAFDLLSNRLTHLGPVLVERVETLPSSIPDDGSCPSRYSCGWPLRGGIATGTIGYDQGCSLGVTARGTNGTRWAYGSGHCSTQGQVSAGTSWQAGGRVIGPIRNRFATSENPGTPYTGVDVALFRIDISYWSALADGYTYYSPDRRVDVNYSILGRGTITENDPVCFSARRIGDNGLF